MSKQAPLDLGQAIRGGDRRALAQAITLCESNLRNDRVQADRLLRDLVAQNLASSRRIAVTGPPGVGKSSFIEAAGMEALAAGHRVAVLSIDPASVAGGGAVLADKTRMAQLARHSEAYVRPSPSTAGEGGVSQRTYESILLCEAAGFDIILIETVGVGQAETGAAAVGDLVVLLLSPGSGDDLQAMKRGVLELADILIVNKADGEQVVAAQTTAADHRLVGRRRPQLPHNSRPEVVLCSCRTGEGIADAWQLILRLHEQLEQAATIAARRTHQVLHRVWAEATAILAESMRRDPLTTATLEDHTLRLRAGQMTPHEAAQELVDTFRRSITEGSQPGNQVGD